eukprot:7276513-Prymnesium_polylepis.1
MGEARNLASADLPQLQQLLEVARDILLGRRRHERRRELLVARRVRVVRIVRRRILPHLVEPIHVRGVPVRLCCQQLAVGDTMLG